VAIDTLVRFLSVTGAASPAWAEKRMRVTPKAQKVIRVTEAVVAKSAAFRFSGAFKGLEVIEAKGSVVATDGDHTWRTPYDDCVLVMPSLRHLRPGTTMVRLGSYS
jgi:hypothetical protein